MKRITFCMVVLTATALVSSAWAGKDKEESQVRVELDLVDGSHIIGTPGIESVPVQTSYAKMDVPMREILAIRIEADHETASLDLRNGDKLKGVVSLRPIKLETAFGKVAIGMEHIRTLHVVLSCGALPDSLNRGLVLYYPFDRDEKGRVMDGSGKENQGEVHGAKWTSKGRVGGAMEFDGQDDYVAGPSGNPAFENDEHTVSAWVKMPRSESKSNAGIAGYWSPGAGSGYGLCFAGSGQLGMIEGQNSTWQYAFADVRIDDGQWHHLVGLRRQGAALLFIDGVRQPGSTDVKPLFHTGQKFMMGFIDAPHVPRQNFPGAMDEVMVFSRALTDNEVKQIYDAQK